MKFDQIYGKGKNMIKRYLIRVTHNNGAGVYYVGKDNIIIGSYGCIEGLLQNKKVSEDRVILHGYKRAGNAKNNRIFAAGPVATACTSVEVLEITYEKVFKSSNHTDVSFNTIDIKKR